MNKVKNPQLLSLAGLLLLALSLFISILTVNKTLSFTPRASTGNQCSNCSGSCDLSGQFCDSYKSCSSGIPVVSVYTCNKPVGAATGTWTYLYDQTGSTCDFSANGCSNILPTPTGQGCKCNGGTGNVTFQTTGGPTGQNITCTVTSTGNCGCPSGKACDGAQSGGSCTIAAGQSSCTTTNMDCTCKSYSWSCTGPNGSLGSGPVGVTNAGDVTINVNPPPTNTPPPSATPTVTPTPPPASTPTPTPKLKSCGESCDNNANILCGPGLQCISTTGGNKCTTDATTTDGYVIRSQCQTGGDCCTKSPSTGSGCSQSCRYSNECPAGMFCNIGNATAGTTTGHCDGASCRPPQECSGQCSAVQIKYAGQTYYGSTSEDAATVVPVVPGTPYQFNFNGLVSCGFGGYPRTTYFQYKSAANPAYANLCYRNGDCGQNDGDYLFITNSTSTNACRGLAGSSNVYNACVEASPKLATPQQYTFRITQSHYTASGGPCYIKVGPPVTPTTPPVSTPTPTPQPPKGTVTGPTSTCYTAGTTFSVTATKGAGAAGLSSNLYITTINNKIPPGCPANQQVSTGANNIGLCKIQTSTNGSYQATYLQSTPGDYYALIEVFNNSNFQFYPDQTCAGNPFYTAYGPGGYYRCGTGTAPNANDSVKFTVSNTANCAPSNTPTPIPSNTPTPTVTPTPIPNGCGYTPCNSTTKPCQAGLQCLQANNGQYYCSIPAYASYCKETPGTASCCNAPTPTPTATPTPTPTNTPTPLPNGCGSTCNPNSPNSCVNGHQCVLANNGQYYCSMPQYVTYCQMNPSSATCCTAPTNTPAPTATPRFTPTPTEIFIAQVSSTPTPTRAPQPTIPSAGKTPPWIFIAAPIALLLLGLVF